MNNDPLQDERLSAYLDGELSEKERAEVERELASSDDQRQLVEEFRALSALLKSVPQEPLGVDFSKQVLRKAERAMLATPRQEGEVSEKNSEGAPLGPADTGSNTIWRRVVWSSLAVAAALLITVFNGQWIGQDHEIAKTSESADMSSAKVAKAGEPVELGGLDDAIAASESEEMKSAVASKVERRSDSSHDEEKRALFFGKGGGEGLNGRVSKSGSQVAKAEISSMPSKPGGQFAGGGGQASKGGRVGKDGRDEGLSISSGTNGAVMGANFIVVNVKMSAEAYENGAFNSLLADNKIHCNDPSNYGVDLESVRERFVGRTVPSRGVGVTSRSPGKSAKAGAQDYIYVEAPEKQIVAAIAQLNTSINKFSCVEVEPSIHMPELQSLVRFNRIGDMPLAAYVAPRAPKLAKQMIAKQSKKNWAAESLPPTEEEDSLREKAVDKLGMKTDSKASGTKLAEGLAEGKASFDPNAASQEPLQARQTVPNGAPLEPGEAGIAQLEDLNRSKFGTSKSSGERNEAETQQKSPQTYSFELGQREQPSDADLPPGYRTSKQVAPNAAPVLESESQNASSKTAINHGFQIQRGMQRTTPNQRLLNRAIETNAKALSSNLFGLKKSKKNPAQAKRVPLDQQLLVKQTLEMHRQANPKTPADALLSLPTPSSGLGLNPGFLDSAPVQQSRRSSTQKESAASDSDGVSDESQQFFQRQAGPRNALPKSALYRSNAEQAPSPATGEGQRKSKKRWDLAEADPTAEGAQQIARQVHKSARIKDNLRVLFLLEVEEAPISKSEKTAQSKEKNQRAESSQESRPLPAKEIEKTKPPGKAP